MFSLAKTSLKRLGFYSNLGATNISAISKSKPSIIVKASISSTGRDVRSEYSFYYNKHKQFKSKKAEELKNKKNEIKENFEQKKRFKFDISKPLDQLLAYSDKK